MPELPTGSISSPTKKTGTKSRKQSIRPWTTWLKTFTHPQQLPNWRKKLQAAAAKFKRSIRNIVTSHLEEETTNMLSE